MAHKREHSDHDVRGTSGYRLNKITRKNRYVYIYIYKEKQIDREKEESLQETCILLKKKGGEK